MVFVEDDCTSTYENQIFTDANCLVTTVPFNISNYCIISMYRSPNDNIVLFLEQLQELLIKIIHESKDKIIIFCGDIKQIVFY